MIGSGIPARLLFHPEPKTTYSNATEPRDYGLTFNTRADGGVLVKRIDYAYARPGRRLRLSAIDTFPDWRCGGRVSLFTAWNERPPG
jgi:hypothetical protein